MVSISQTGVSKAALYRPAPAVIDTGNRGVSEAPDAAHDNEEMAPVVAIDHEALKHEASKGRGRDQERSLKCRHLETAAHPGEQRRNDGDDVN